MWAIVQGIFAAALILVLGQIPLGLFVTVNLKYSPSIPWLLPATMGTLWFLFRYLNGHGPPASTAAKRRQLLRGQALPAGVWFWSLFAGALGITSAMCLAFIAVRITHLSQRSLDAPLDYANLPPQTIFALITAIALTAGVVEEAAFRGYLLSFVQARHGWTIAFLFSSTLFLAAHLTHAYSSLAFAPFFLAHCLVLTLLVYCTRSILPSIVIHAVSDFIVLPIQYGFIGRQLPDAAAPYAVVSLFCALAAAAAFWQTARRLQPRNHELCSPAV